MAFAVAVGCAGFSTTAGAQQLVVPVRVMNEAYGASSEFFAGPALVGDRVVFAQRVDAPAFVVRSLDPSGAAHVVGRMRVDPRYGSTATLAAAPDRVALKVSQGWGDRYESHNFDAVFSGPLDGPLSGPQGCTPKHCPPCERDVPIDVALTAGAQALTEYVSDTTGCHARVRVTGDDGAGAPVQRLYDGAYKFSLAGDFLALSPNMDGGDELTRVVDWRTGADAYGGVFDDHGPPLLDDDGTTAGYVDARPAYATPDEPYAHLLALPRDAKLMAIDTGRVAFFTPRTVGETTLSGQVQSTPSPPVFGGMAVNRNRLAWAIRPCAVVDLVVWDLSQPPPGLPGRRCAAASAARRPGAVVYGDYDPVVTVPLRCRPTVGQGCAGTFEVLSPRRHRRPVSLAKGSYAIAPGTTATVGAVADPNEIPPGRRRLAVLVRLRATGSRRTIVVRRVVINQVRR